MSNETTCIGKPCEHETEDHCDEHRPAGFTDPDGYVWKHWAMAWFEPGSGDSETEGKP